MLRLALLSLVLLARAGAAAPVCVDGACASYEAERGGTRSVRCDAEGQWSQKLVEVGLGVAWVTYAERCDNSGDHGSSYQAIAAGAAGQDAHATWYQEGRDAERTCGMEADGAALPCAVGPPVVLP